MFKFKFVKHFLLVLLPSILIVTLLWYYLKNLLIINRSIDLQEITFTKALIAFIFILFGSSFLYSFVSIFVLYSILKDIYVSIKLYRCLIYLLVVLNFMSFGFYYYLNLKSEKNLRSTLKQKVNDINNKSLFHQESLDFMNNIQKSFYCCGFNHSGDYTKKLKENSCAYTQIVTTPMYKTIKYRIEPSAYTGCFYIVYFLLNDRPEILILFVFIIGIVKILVMRSVSEMGAHLSSKVKHETQLCNNPIILENETDFLNLNYLSNMKSNYYKYPVSRVQYYPNNIIHSTCDRPSIVNAYYNPDKQTIV